MQIKGIIVPILTPMNADETIDEEGLRQEIERLLSCGVHGIFPSGTNGEGYTLNEAEKERILSICIDQVNGRVPVYAGTGMISTRDTVRLSQKAESMGADALSIITPYFASASQEELYEHYRKISSCVKIPILLYNIPARTGNTLAPATVERLSTLDHIAGIKDSSGNFDNILQYINRTRGNDFVVLSGNDSLILWTLIAGGTGGVAGCANVFPRNMVSIYDRFLAGDMTGARLAQEAIRPLRDCFRYGNSNVVIKEAAIMLGHRVGKCRAPFNRLSDEGYAVLRQVLEHLTAKGVC